MTDVTELVKVLREEADWCKAIEWEIPICTEDHIREAADLIEQLSSKCRQLEMELHAAIADLKEAMPCRACKHLADLEYCKNCYSENHWEWRGIL